MRYYCQFHHGGFRTYYIEGLKNESLKNIISAENRYELPPKTEADLNNNSMRLVYRQVDDNTLSLVVRCIPSIETDTTGKAIDSAIMFVGNLDERKQFESLVAYCKLKSNDFDEKIKSLFSLRGGLSIDGSLFMEFLEKEVFAFEYKAIDNSLEKVFSNTINLKFVCSLALGSNSLVVGKPNLPDKTRGGQSPKKVIILSISIIALFVGLVIIKKCTE